MFAELRKLNLNNLICGQTQALYFTELHKVFKLAIHKKLIFGDLESLFMNWLQVEFLFKLYTKKIFYMKFKIMKLI
jgi:hypothetical protein